MSQSSDAPLNQLEDWNPQEICTAGASSPSTVGTRGQTQGKIMSTRSSIFYHNDQSAGVGIHIYTELASDKENDVRLEIEHPNGVVNVSWPEEAFTEEMRKRI